jgi:hypothetical protein
MKNMEITNLVDSIANIRQHGDAVKIANLVNEIRRKAGEKLLSPATVRSMLNGNRTPAEDVANIASKFYEAQQKAQQLLSEISL